MKEQRNLLYLLTTLIIFFMCSCVEVQNEVGEVFSETGKLLYPESDKNSYLNSNRIGDNSLGGENEFQGGDSFEAQQMDEEDIQSKTSIKEDIEDGAEKAFSNLGSAIKDTTDKLFIEEDTSSLKKGEMEPSPLPTPKRLEENKVKDSYIDLPKIKPAYRR